MNDHAEKKKTGSGTDKMNRRDFLHKAAVGSVIGAGAMAVLGSLQLPLPKVFNEPPSQFKIGNPGDFPIDTYHLIADRNVFILRDQEGIRALSAICTHLGCIVKQTDKGFQCPCHGSNFAMDGEVQTGPAPRGLDWLLVDMAPDGQLTVDLDKKVDRSDVFMV
jgi:cytochrome b6-f complex iron-sulfur subunit